MEPIGIYHTEDGRIFDCKYDKDSKRAIAIGPLPDPDNSVGFRGVFTEVFTHNFEEAKRQLSKKIGDGVFV